jgi:nucleoside-diphosphate-sugar epimerase
MSKIVVTGAGGYIGTQILRDLLNLGHSVVGIDRFFFGMDPVTEFNNSPRIELVKKDIRDLSTKDFSGVDAVFDLACLSNDPAGEIDPQLTYQINRDGRIHVAETAKKAGVKKYILSSSCSVYGQGDELKLTEKSKTNPISVYAKSTLEAEQHNLGLSDNNFSVSALRNATVFGLSTRMRFDLVVNLMTISAFQKERIIVMGGGLQWRPLVHLKDVSQAFVSTFKAPTNLVNQNVFNIGLINIQIKNLAYIVRENIPLKVEIDIAPDDTDKRDYNVDFSKAEDILGFKAQTSIPQGVVEIYEALKGGNVDTGPKTITVQWYKNILEAKKLIDSIYLNKRMI